MGNYLQKPGLHIKKNRFAVKLMSCITAGMLIFSSIYKKELLSRNYIACSGIPSGWMPGLATKYVKEKTSCKKNGNN